jgi:N-acetyl-gamma-glutamyl-phosphate reductase
MKIKAGIVGVTGYAGVELLRILMGHPQVEVAAVSSVSFEGKPVSSVYPSLYGLCQLECSNQEEVLEKSDVVFACLPHGLSQELAAQCYREGKVFIDLGADFRLYDEEDYKAWYGGEFLDKALHEKAVYALPELFRGRIKETRVVSNPGCYPTTVALGLSPALKEGLVSTEGIIVDSKSGVTGAGRGLSQTTHYPDCNEAFSPYKIAVHRHTPEMEQSLSIAAGEPVRITFVPHLLPVNRGIVSTLYAKLKRGVAKKEIRAAYEKAYADEYFVRVLPSGSVANLKNVKFSNFCDISLHIDERTGMLIVVSAIDNMVKGAAGQAVQNMNIVFGLAETAGLTMIPPAF